MDKIELCWLDLENAVKARDFKIMMRRYWVLFYTLWPEKRKNKAKPVEETINAVNELLDPAGVAKRCDEIGDLLKVKTE